MMIVGNICSRVKADFSPARVSWALILGGALYYIIYIANFRPLGLIGFSVAIVLAGIFKIGSRPYCFFMGTALGIWFFDLLPRALKIHSFFPHR